MLKKRPKRKPSQGLPRPPTTLHQTTHWSAFLRCGWSYWPWVPWGLWGSDEYTLPETNSLHLKMDGWKTSFLLGWPIFRGELLVLGSVNSYWKTCQDTGIFGGFSICKSNSQLSLPSSQLNRIEVESGIYPTLRYFNLQIQESTILLDQMESTWIYQLFWKYFTFGTRILGCLEDHPTSDQWLILLQAIYN